MLARIFLEASIEFDRASQELTSRRNTLFQNLLDWLERYHADVAPLAPAMRRQLRLMFPEWRWNNPTMRGGFYSDQPDAQTLYHRVRFLISICDRTDTDSLQFRPSDAATNRWRGGENALVLCEGGPGGTRAIASMFSQQTIDLLQTKYHKSVARTYVPRYDRDLINVVRLLENRAGHGIWIYSIPMQCSPTWYIIHPEEHTLRLSSARAITCAMIHLCVESNHARMDMTEISSIIIEALLRLQTKDTDDDTIVFS